jgi:transcriptional regulator with XRE-family HTH domain
MTPTEFKRWRENMKLSQERAADALGLSKGSIELYERGSRRDEDRPVVIPRTVELACAALARGITTYSEQAQAPSGAYQVVQIETGAYGEQILRTVIGPPFPIRSEAVSLAKNEARAFAAHGYNEEHTYWWGRNSAGSVFRFVVVST